ncbi:MAG: hypothetical protein WCI72_05080 [archaeon]
MQRNTIRLSKEGREYCLIYSSNGESTTYVAKKVDERETLEPLTFTDCLRIVDRLPPEFYAKKVKVEISRVDSPLIDVLEEDAFRAFVRLCEISSK